MAINKLPSLFKWKFFFPLFVVHLNNSNANVFRTSLLLLLICFCFDGKGTLRPTVRLLNLNCLYLTYYPIFFGMTLFYCFWDKKIIFIHSGCQVGPYWGLSRKKPIPNWIYQIMETNIFPIEFLPATMLFSSSLHQGSFQSQCPLPYSIIVLF